MGQSKGIGHVAALGTAIIWGVTFISTKYLLRDFAPVEILFVRFLLGFAALWVAYPKKMRLKDKKHEWYFVLAGISGVTLYFLFENIALTYTLASNVGVIVSIAPCFTALIAQFIFKEEKVSPWFYLGFLVAIVGVALISFNGSVVLKLNPLGDILAILSTLFWAIYSNISRKISLYQYHTIQSTRRIFFYGILFMIPFLFIFKAGIGLARFTDLGSVFNFVFLGFGASAMCFATWNFALSRLGAVKTSVYIYLVPVVTIIASVIFLKEHITGLAWVGTALTILGLFLSDRKGTDNKASVEEEPSV